jgi:hypothetical protein
MDVVVEMTGMIESRRRMVLVLVGEEPRTPMGSL